LDLPVEPWIIALLMVAAFIAAFVDSIVGGGGVISLPSVLLAFEVSGLPVHFALGTNKLAATGASSMATLRYTNAGYVYLPLMMGLIPFAVVGSFLGAASVLLIEPWFVKGAVMTVMVAMTLYVLFRPQLGHENRFTKLELGQFAICAAAVLAIGFYDGFLGPGTGSLLLFLFLGVPQFDFLRSAANGRVLNFATNLAALVLFAIKGAVVYVVGLPMMLSMMAGAYFGSHYGMKHGATWVKPLFVTMTGLILVRLAFF
jgi:uncharacterized protein